jgi:hypothetical protein
MDEHHPKKMLDEVFPIQSLAKGRHPLPVPSHHSANTIPIAWSGPGLPGANAESALACSRQGKTSRQREARRTGPCTPL